MHFEEYNENIGLNDSSLTQKVINTKSKFNGKYFYSTGKNIELRFGRKWQENTEM